MNIARLFGFGRRKPPGEVEVSCLVDPAEFGWTGDRSVDEPAYNAWLRDKLEACGFRFYPGDRREPGFPTSRYSYEPGPAPGTILYRQWIRA